jgi:hypothetical protein
MNDLQPKKSRSKKILRWFLFALILALSIFVYVRYYYVYSTGVRAGELNYLVHKGVIFKTYEGKLVQSGFRADKPGGLQSNQFDFSVTDREIARRLMLSSGKNVQLQYREYFGRLPWRGFTRFVVDSIISIQDAAPNSSVESGLMPYVLESN